MRSGSQASYVPGPGDLVWIDLDPTVGHEQAGRRPALVLSDTSYNARSHLLLACPITARRKGYAFEVALPEGAAVHGVVLADQLKSLDWSKRNVELIAHAPKEVVANVLERAAALLGIAAP